MSKIRVLVVDNAVVVRRLVTDALSTDPELQVVGTAPNGRIALAKIPQINPDLVTLDIEMPELDGIATLRELRRTYPTLPVVMFSTLTERGAAATLDALALGANDYVTKPANVGSVTAALEAVKGELIPKVKALCAGRRLPAARSIPVPRIPSERWPQLPAGPVQMLTIGVSTGGPEALARVLPALPADLPVPVTVVQHMPPVFTRLLAERLSSRCALPVMEAKGGMEVTPGRIYIAPGDFHLTVERAAGAVVTKISQGPPENSCRPAVDVLFRSVADVYKPHILAVEMTGMGQDGLRGCEHIREAGGQILAQDQASSVVWGMPGFVANAGLADKVLPLDQIGAEIIRRIRNGREFTGGFRSTAQTAVSSYPK